MSKKENTRVECILTVSSERREKGRQITLFDKVYRFRPVGEFGALVADIADKKHREALYRTGGYRPYEEDAPVPVSAPTANDPALAAALRNSTITPETQQPPKDESTDTAGLMGASKEIPDLTAPDGVVWTAPQIVQRAYEVSGFPQKAWNNMSQEERDNRILDVIEELKLTADEKEKSADEQERNERDRVAAEYHKLFGRAPHHKWTVDRINDEIKSEQERRAKEGDKSEDKSE